MFDSQWSEKMQTMIWLRVTDESREIYIASFHAGHVTLSFYPHHAANKNNMQRWAAVFDDAHAWLIRSKEADLPYVSWMA